MYMYLCCSKDQNLFHYNLKSLPGVHIMSYYYIVRFPIAFEDDQLDDEDYALIAENTGIQLQRVYSSA